MTERYKYARFKVIYISKCLRDGTVPVPGTDWGCGIMTGLYAIIYKEPKVTSIVALVDGVAHATASSP